jgi:hypothetical protein
VIIIISIVIIIISIWIIYNKDMRVIIMSLIRVIIMNIIRVYNWVEEEYNIQNNNQN